MSTPLALAAITAVLRGQVANWIAEHHLVAHLGADITVSALPPDRITTGADERPQINLFLYAVTPNTAMRRSEPGSLSRPPAGGYLALDLHYLVSAYGVADLQIETLLGYAIHALQQVSSLDRETLRAMLTTLASTSGGMSTPLIAEIGAETLAESIVEVTISPQFPGIEELSRIWSALQARYRPSMSYRVSAVIIETSGRAG
ncbi:DUF4255 domain-containing protein [Oscillochloris sp. ZM17-4]|uniref:DUF4255 domain-containing protein n=1 Tax=Oscillochloris sp. ZM17-4 TaxID=2866714 RepID=UPI001C73753A|nr:DUF4255 domain-containing protein [Oscillochloris sp. ZM17-4]